MYAVLATVAFAAQGVTARLLHDRNVFNWQTLQYVVTKFATVLLVPFALRSDLFPVLSQVDAEGNASAWSEFWSPAREDDDLRSEGHWVETVGQGWLTLIYCSCFYLQMALAFKVIETTHPLTYAVVNSGKRLAVILFSIFHFATQVTYVGLCGTVVAIGGCFLYSYERYRAVRYGGRPLLPISKKERE